MFPLLGVALVASACVESTTTRLSTNTIRIDVSASPECGRARAIKLVNRMAAVETLRLGYDKYIIVGADSQSNVGVVGYTAQSYGSYGYGSYNANTFATPIYGGTQDAAVIVQLFSAKDRNGAQALDARSALGPNWQTIIAEPPPTTC